MSRLINCLIYHVALARPEPLQNIGGRVHSRRRPAQPDLEPPESGVAQRLGHRLHSVVASRPSSGTDPKPPERKVDVVMDNQQTLDFHPVISHQVADRPAGDVHHPERKTQQHPLAPNPYPGRLTPCSQRSPPPARLMPRGKDSNGLCADVVPGPRILLAGIPQSYDHLHFISLPGAPDEPTSPRGRLGPSSQESEARRKSTWRT